MNSRRPRHTLATAGLVAASLSLAWCATAPATTYAPTDRPGPALTVPTDKLKAALYCQPGVRDSKVTPVLLNPGTGITAEDNYSWNWEPALDKLGIPWCAYTAPYFTLGDIQTSGEYLVYAIRAVHALSGRKIAILGHSQGGMSPRWALRFWPDTRRLVDDIIGIAPSNHGTTQLTPSRCASGCAPALWQQAHGSAFLQALNSQTETFAGISYTNIYTHTEEVVQPNTGTTPADCSSCLFNGDGQIRNVAIQDVCPADIAEHVLIGTTDPTAYVLAVDALAHPGPADPKRIAASVCAQLAMPGVDVAHAQGVLSTVAHGGPVFGIVLAIAGAGQLAAYTGGAPPTPSAPPLACYATASCPATTPLKLTVTPRTVTARRRTRLRLKATVDIDGVVSPIRDATIRIAGRRLRTDADGRATLRVRWATRGKRAAKATADGFLPVATTIRATGPR